METIVIDWSGWEGFFALFGIIMLSMALYLGICDLIVFIYTKVKDLFFKK